MIGAAIKAVEPARRGVMARQLNALKKTFAKRLRTAHDPEEVRSIRMEHFPVVDTCLSGQEIEDLRVELASMTASA